MAGRQLPLALLLLACQEPTAASVAQESAPPAVVGGLSFERTLVDGDIAGPAFTEVADINGDGRHDIAVSAFGRIQGTTLPAGSVTLYLQGDDLDSWSRRTVFGPDEGIYWPNDLTLHDLDEDGDLDLVFGAGFLVCGAVPGTEPCGGLIWFEQTPDRWVRHDVVKPTSTLFYHRVIVQDLDHDGHLDLMSVGEQRPLPGQGPDRAQAHWFKGLGPGAGFESRPRLIGPGLGSIPSALDVDGDGDMDLASAEFFANTDASYVWYERLSDPSPLNPAGAWRRHVMDATSGPSIQLAMIPNLFGDGRMIGVGSNHVNTRKDPPDPWDSEISVLEPGADPRQPWRRTAISRHITSVAGSRSAPQAAPGIFGHGDADGDGDIDLIVSGDGDPRVFLLEQSSPGAFLTHEFDNGIAQAGGMKIVDLDGNGDAEVLVTGYENNSLYLYRHVQGGAHPLGPARPPVEGEGSEGLLELEVRYDGPIQGNVYAALFDSWPPAGPPQGYESAQAPTFPLGLTMAGLAPGEYTLLVGLDAEPFDAQNIGPEDLSVTTELTIPARSPVVIDLAQGAAGQERSQSFGSLDVEVHYDGDERGQLIIGLFESLPPAGPPAVIEIVDARTFPIEVTLSDIPHGSWQALAYLDLPPQGTTFPGPEDPIAGSEPISVGDDPARVRLDLATP